MISICVFIFVIFCIKLYNDNCAISYHPIVKWNLLIRMKTNLIFFYIWTFYSRLYGVACFLLLKVVRLPIIAFIHFIRTLIGIVFLIIISDHLIFILILPISNSKVASCRLGYAHAFREFTTNRHRFIWMLLFCQVFIGKYLR